MKKEILEQAILDYIGEKFKDKVLDKRVQTFFTYSELVDTVFSFAELLNKNIEELEKENTELREESDFYNKERGNYKAMYLKEILKKKRTKDLLTKAKELLKEAQGYIENIDDEGDELYDKIEQFLEEK